MNFTTLCQEQAQTCSNKSEHVFFLFISFLYFFFLEFLFRTWISFSFHLLGIYFSYKIHIWDVNFFLPLLDSYCAIYIFASILVNFCQFYKFLSKFTLIYYILFVNFTILCQELDQTCSKKSKHVFSLFISFHYFFFLNSYLGHEFLFLFIYLAFTLAIKFTFVMWISFYLYFFCAIYIFASISINFWPIFKFLFFSESL